MILKHKNHAIIILIILFFSFILSSFIDLSKFTKTSYKIQFSLYNYYLGSAVSSHDIVDRVYPLLKSDIFNVRDKSYNSKECNFLDKNLNPYTITPNPRDNYMYETEMFTNKKISSKNFEKCFNYFENNMNKLKDQLFDTILRTSINELEESINIIENDLNSKDLISIKFEYLQKISSYQSLLMYIQQKDLINIRNKNLYKLIIKQYQVFLAISVLLIFLYLLIINIKNIKNNFLKKIFN